jgi:hypothetical protein
VQWVLVPGGTDDGLLVRGERVVGLLAGEHTGDVAVPDAGEGLELAADAGPVVDLLGGAAALIGTGDLGRGEQVVVDAGGCVGSHVRTSSVQVS